MRTSDSSTSVHRKKRLISTILLTGLLAGALDILAAMLKFYIDTGKEPSPIFKYIARGIFTREEVLAGGSTMIVWGLVFHFLIAMIFTAFLFLIYPTVIKWFKNKIVTGVIYGLFVWVIMNRVVLPLSNTPKPPAFDVKNAVINMLILIFMIGIPVALIAHRYYFRVSRDRTVH